MKHQHQNQDGLNFDLLGIGKPGAPVAKPEPKREEIDPAVGMNFLLNLFNSESSQAAKIRQPANDVRQPEPEPEEDQWWLDKVTDDVEPIVTKREPVSDLRPMMSVDPAELDVDKVVAGVKAFSKDIVDNLEHSAASLKLSTGELFVAGLGVAMNLSLLTFMGITRNDDGGYELPPADKITETVNTYGMFLTIGHYGYTDMRQFIADHEDDFERIEPGWDEVLNRCIASRTNLTADDSITITSLLEETWCEEPDDDDETNLAESLEALLGHVGHDHDDCDDDDEDDETDGRISVIMESSNDDDVDIMTITGIDNRSLTFFIEDYIGLVTAANEEFVDAGNGMWEWLCDMLPAFTVRTSRPKVILGMNDKLDHDIRFVQLFRDGDDTIIGVYLLEEGLFDPDDDDSQEVIRVINELFRSHLTPTLSQRRRIAKRFESLMESETNLLQMLADGGVDIEQLLQEESVETETTGTDDPIVEPEADGKDEDLGEIGCEVAEMFTTSSDKPTTNDDPAATKSDDLIFKPITRKKHQS